MFTKFYFIFSVLMMCCDIANPKLVKKGFLQMVSHASVQIDFNFSFLLDKTQALHNEKEKILQAIYAGGQHSEVLSLPHIIHRSEAITRKADRIRQIAHLVQSPYPQRSKRFLGLLLGGMSLTMSVYNTYEITQLKSRILHVEDSQQQLVRKFKGAFKTVKDAIRKGSKTRHELDMALVLETDLTQVDDLLNTAMNGINQALAGEVPVSLWSPEEIQHLLNIVTEKAKKRGMDVKITAHEFFLLPVKTEFSENSLSIFIQVPLTTNMYELYRLFDTPQWIRTDKVDHVLTLKPPKPMLAVASTDLPVLELNEDDLFDCSKVFNSYTCLMDRYILIDDIESTCLGAYMVNNTLKIDQHCEKIIEPIVETKIYYHGEKGRYVIVSPSPQVAVIECGPETEQRMLSGPIDSIQLDKSCRARIDGKTAVHSESFDLHMNYTIPSVITLLPPEALEEAFRKWNKSDEQIDKLLTFSDLKFERLATSENLVIIIVLILLNVLSILCYHWLFIKCPCRKKRPTKRPPLDEDHNTVRMKLPSF